MKHKTSYSRTGIQKLLTGLMIFIIFALFGWATHTTTAAPLPIDGSPTQIYASENRDDLRNLFRTAISSAKESVFLLVYTLTDPTIIHALSQKAAQGVPVEVIVDAKASPHAAQRLGPQVKTLRRLGMGLMHCKLLIIDRKLVWIGSANMTADSLQMHSNLVLGMDSAPLAAFLADRAEKQTETGRAPHVPQTDFLIGGQKVEFWFLPDNAKLAVRRIRELMRGAQKSICVAMFTWTRNDFAHEVVHAANRGVKVQVVIDVNSGKGASAKTVAYLKANGIDVRLSRGTGLLHHKFMVVDGKTLVNGSANWTRAAFGSNDDCFVIIDDLNAGQIEKLEQQWRVLYADSEAA